MQNQTENGMATKFRVQIMLRFIKAYKGYVKIFWDPCHRYRRNTDLRSSLEDLICCTAPCAYAGVSQKNNCFWRTMASTKGSVRMMGPQ